MLLDDEIHPAKRLFNKPLAIRSNGSTVRARWTTKVHADGKGSSFRSRQRSKHLLFPNPDISRKVAYVGTGQVEWAGRDRQHSEGKRREVNMLLPLVGFRVWAEIKKRRIGGQGGTMVVWPGAQDQRLQAAHIQALSLSPLICT